MGGHAPHGQRNASDARFVACPGKAEGRKETERPPALQSVGDPVVLLPATYPSARQSAIQRTPPSPLPSPDPVRVDCAWTAHSPTLRAGYIADDTPQWRKRLPRTRAPPRGRPAAAPATPSQVGGNRDRTAPPQARQTEHGTGAGHAEGHGPHGTALPAPSAGTTRDARATPPSGERTPRERERTHTKKDTRGPPEGQPDRARGTHRPPGMAYQRARVRDTRTGRPATRNAGCAGREGGRRGNTTPGTGPNPPEPAASAAHTQTGHCTRQGSSGAQRHAPTPRLGSHRASPRGSHWRQASSTGPAAPVPRATTH